MVLLITGWYSPLTSCSNDTAVVWVWMLWRIVRWRWRINVELIVQHVSTICQTTDVYLVNKNKSVHDSACLLTTPHEMLDWNRALLHATMFIMMLNVGLNHQCVKHQTLGNVAAPQYGTHSLLAFALVLHHILVHSVVFLKRPVSTRPWVPPSGSCKCLRFSLGWHCTLKHFIYLFIYLLTYIIL